MAHAEEHTNAAGGPLEGQSPRTNAVMQGHGGKRPWTAHRPFYILSMEEAVWLPPCEAPPRSASSSRVGYSILENSVSFSQLSHQSTRPYTGQGWRHGLSCAKSANTICKSALHCPSGGSDGACPSHVSLPVAGVVKGPRPLVTSASSFRNSSLPVANSHKGDKAFDGKHSTFSLDGGETREVSYLSSILHHEIPALPTPRCSQSRRVGQRAHEGIDLGAGSRRVHEQVMDLQGRSTASITHKAVLHEVGDAGGGRRIRHLHGSQTLLF